MMQKLEHPWNLPPKEAVDLQKQLSRNVIRKSTIKRNAVRKVAGIDTAYRKGVACAAVVVLKFKGLETLEFKTAARPIEFPYVPGLLSFREGPVILAALDKLKSTPDLLIIDGQGVAHPRRLGIASHIGLLVDIPSIGCAKSKLLGHYEEPGTKRGSFSYLTYHDDIIGAVVRTRTKVKPVYVSIGHRVNLRQSIQFVLHCCKGYRLPETTRQADKLSRRPTNCRL
jgi:deoxyribonuclease V